MSRFGPATSLRLLVIPVLLALAVLPAPAARAEPTSDVIVILDDIGIASAQPTQRRAQVDAAVEAVLSDHVRDGMLVRYRYHAVPAFAASVSAETLGALSADSRVRKVMPDLGGHGADFESFALVHGAQAHALGYDGQGVTVAVIDSGVAAGHPDFAGAIVHEECFMAAAGLSSRCPNGSTYQQGAGAAADDLGHGTNVAGVIAGRGVQAPIGVAQKASLSVYKIIDNNNTFYFSDLFAAIDDILDNPSTVDIVNMSLGTFIAFTPGSCTPDPFFDRLRTAGILAFASTMNEGYKNSLGYPACVGSIVSVGAVYDDYSPGYLAGFCSDVPVVVDDVACWSNSDPTLDLLAPGCAVTSAGLGGGTSTYCGTSQAAPHAAGAAALLLQQRYDATPDEMETRLKSTGVPRTDPDNGVTTRRIDLQAAVSVPAMGDVDCDFRVNVEDVVATLRHAGGVGGSAGGACPDIGTTVGGRVVGDVTCEDVVSPLDALRMLLYYARVPQPPGTPSCPAVGEPLG